MNRAMIMTVKYFSKKWYYFVFNVNKNNKNDLELGDSAIFQLDKP